MTLAAVIVAAHVANGQPESPAAPTVCFTVFSARPIGDVAFTPRENAAPQVLTFYPTVRSPRYEYRGEMPLRFIESETGSVVAEADIPEGVRDALLLFVPMKTTRSGEKLRYQIWVLDDAATRHGPGGLVIINLSGLALNGAVGDRDITLRAGLNPPLPIGGAAKILLRTPAHGRSYQAYADDVRLRGNERALLILFPPYYQGAYEVQSRLLVDEPPAAATASKANRN